MPTKILVLETPQFQLGANAGADSERLDPSKFLDRVKQHAEEFQKDPSSNNVLFVLAPAECKSMSGFEQATLGPSPVSICYFASQKDAIQFLPTLLIFAASDRSQGLKDSLQEGSTIYSESFFNGKGLGARLDPAFTFARTHLDAASSAKAWACMQSLIFLGLQSLPEQGEKGTGEKVDVQIGADGKVLAFTVRFEAKAEQLSSWISNPVLALARSTTGTVETRFIQAGNKIEFNCLFFPANGPERTIEIQSFHKDAALEDANFVKEYAFKNFAEIGNATPAAAPKKGKGGFKKKFSDQVNAAAPSAAPAAAAEVPAQVAQLEEKIKALEASLKTQTELAAKAVKEGSDPMKKRDVLTNIKDSQSEGLKQNIKMLEGELEEAKKREKELMTMVDKAVQMKDEAAKRIKELDVKLKQAGGNQGSKVTMLERQIEEQKRQNKELSKRITELMEKARAA